MSAPSRRPRQTGPPAPSLPFVTVIMPVRNEADYIAQSLGAVLAQDYPADRLEVIVADGMSEDATRARVGALSAGPVPVTMIDNPEGIVPTALNRALRQARGDVIVRVDGHCVIPPSYLRRCLNALDRTGADCAGGSIETVGETATARAIALAMSSPFGVGGVAFRTGRPEGTFVDTLAFGAYRRAVFSRLGGFDEELVRNQDDEFNLRLLRAGGRIWMEPDLVTTYYSRTSLRRLWRQYHQYGVYKVRVMQKHRRVAAWRQLVPAAFVLALLASVVLAAATGTVAWLLPVVGLYALANALAALWTARRAPWLAPRIAAAYLILHLSYGLGMLHGLWRWRHSWGEVYRVPPDPA